MDYKILLQPYRFLIVATLGENDATVKELMKKLPDIPQAAMYRCIKTLEKASFIKKTSERKIKGAIEATYGLNFSMEKMTLEDTSVNAYLTAAYAVFFSYVHHKLVAHVPITDVDESLQLSKFNSIAINIKKEDLNLFKEETDALLKKYMSGDGDRYQLTTFLVPDITGGK